ncbi:glutamate--tRNA ligase [bacterium]|nr:glutamate--tRNA ligase [bacterium]
MNTNSKNVRVRFAPSPTGFLHVGGARTAIFNWLFAKKHGGQFLLRIEDTDAERSDQQMVEVIFQGLKWLDLNWDEPPIFQSERLPLYRNHADRLLSLGKAYKCFCTPDTLGIARAQAAKEKRTFKYDQTCLHLSGEEVAKLEAERPYAVRLRVDEDVISFEDEVYGEIKVMSDQIDDFIILRSDGRPTYHLAVVIDDHEMGITHVIRGEDHVSNTPKHLLLYRAFGWAPPTFAHLPLIIGPDQQRLSKRHGATAISEYRSNGFLADAMFNFLALLGWSSGDDRELFSRAQLVKEFDLSSVMKKSAVFDERKLQWMNGQYIMNLDDESLLDLALPQLLQSRLIDGDFADTNRALLLRITGLLKTRMRQLTEFAAMAGYFFADPEQFDEKAVRKHWKDPELPAKFDLLQQRLAALETFTTESIEEAMRALAEELEMSAAKLIHPTRVALTGVAATPSLFEVMEILGQEAVLRRIQKARELLQASLWNR